MSRYNTFNDMYVAIQTHGTKSAGGPDRGCIGYEAYDNYFTGSYRMPKLWSFRIQKRHGVDLEQHDGSGLLPFL